MMDNKIFTNGGGMRTSRGGWIFFDILLYYCINVIIKHYISSVLLFFTLYILQKVNIIVF